ncbi:MAG: bifunctional [glutamine synthetase] adenylyltransferase/[glutamine synthetase]-adenylyl-L-tyrosine phosphorylase [Pseudomonadota bacterium]
MTLADTLAPLPGAVDEAFLADLEAAEGGPLPLIGEEAKAALGTVADVSLFLRHLMLRYPKDLTALLTRPLDETVAIAASVAPEDDLTAVMSQLRQSRRHVALAVGLADLCAGASVQHVTGALSRFADAAVGVALQSVLLDGFRRGQLTTTDPHTCGLAVLAFGKLGAHELNYSSDIDLVVVYDPARAAACGITSGRAVRLTQRMTQVLQARTEEGFVFRVDLRLRPDPSATPVAVAMPSAIAYFQSRARAWEQQAVIKARVIAGDESAGRAFLSAISPSVWHGFFDFTAIEDTMETRRQIALVKGAGAITVPGHNVKLGRGGIRELEFFVQTLQRLAGGRDRRLRGRASLDMLVALTNAGWIDAATRDSLHEAYVRLRRIEHRLQMVADEQTHTMPDEDGVPRIARMMGEVDTFEDTMVATLQTVHHHFTNLPNIVSRSNPVIATAKTGNGLPEGEVGEAIKARFAAWQDAPYGALRTERARRLLKGIEPALGDAFSTSADPLGVLDGFDTFLSWLPAGVQILSRLNHQRDLIPVLVLIAGSAPRLAEQLARHARLLDVLIDPAFFGRLPDEDELASQLQQGLAEAQDYEGRLDALRVFGQEQALLVSARVLAGSLTGQSVGEAYARLADCIVAAALKVATDEFEVRHGRLDEGATALVALGKYGGKEMTATSDLDLVFLYNCAPEAGQSDGEKGLPPGHYYARLAQRVVAALSAPTAKGSLYEVDLRLRPSGRSGPLATHITSFERYHAESAWVWEHLALTRARVVAGDGALGVRARVAVDQATTRHRDREALVADVLAMRKRLADQSAEGLKHAPGGQVDIEFIAQFLQLAEGGCTGVSQVAELLSCQRDNGTLADGPYETLLAAHGLYQRLSQVIAIASHKTLALEDTPAPLQPLLLRAADAPDMDYLMADVAERRTAVRTIFTDLIGAID